MKQMLLAVMFGALACLAQVCGAQADRFREANQRFDAGDFQGAASIYQELLDKQGPSAAVLFNLGNCQQRLGKHGAAILAYERARLLTPRDPDLRANLALARKAAAVFEDTGPYPRVEALFGFLSLNEWSWVVAGAALALGVLAIARGVWRSPGRGVRRAMLAASCFAMVGVLAGAAALFLRRGEANRGVVVAENATVRLSPFEEAEALGTPGPGRIVRLLKTEKGFHYVEIPGTDLRGWMADQDVVSILPAGSQG